MTERSPVKAQRHAHAAMLFCLSLILVFGGCAARQLSSFKEHVAAHDYAWIAAQQVTCNKAGDVCGQLHLIKGDACFRLAKADTSPKDNYACAADALEKGLALNRTWNDAGIHRQFRENLCESLRNLQDLQSGETAAQTLDRFVDAAEALYQLAPKSVPGVFYLAKARLRQVQPMLLDINAATRAGVCNRLKRAVTGVLSMMETAKQTSLPDWERFADNYQRLSFELGAAIHTAQCP